MSRISPVHPDRATGKTKKLFDAVRSKFGEVPNLARVLAQAPVALEGYLNFSGALANGRLSAKNREQIALTVAESNLCGYCLSAHSFVGARAGLTEAEIADARHANAANARENAILKLARNLVVQRGEISDDDLAATRAAGLSEGEIVETIANVALSIFTNYLNHVARTVIDFPEVKPGNGYRQTNY